MTPAAPVPVRNDPNLSMTLALLAEETLDFRLSRTLRSMSADLDRGSDWSEVLRTHQRRLPPVLAGAFEIAQASGRLPNVLGEYIEVMRRNRQARRRMMLSLMYPFIVLLLTVALLGGMLLFLVPGFASMFNDFGMELPAMTVGLIGLSLFLTEHVPLVAAGMAIAAGLMLALILLPRLPLGGALGRMLQSVPVLGTASWMAAAAEFFSLLAILVDAQKPLPEALRLTGKSLTDSNLRDGVGDLSRLVEHGEPAAEAAALLPNFRPAVVQVLRHSQRPTAFARILRTQAELFSLQAEAMARLAIVWIEPVMLALIGLVVGFIVLSLFLPLVKLLNELA
ncbi:MAG: type II secretion system F family protein [Planctomyces sp.]|nr:type II secretion system F family protein [Planctomyces sp.]